MRDLERELRERLRDERAPDERGAEERGWRVVAAARAEREAVPAAERRGRGRRRALQAALAVGLVALAVSPAGASVRHWVADRVEPGVEHAKPALTSLPARGSLLVQSARGPWVVHPDGAKRLLGDYAESSWSPHGLFVVATRGHELAALEPDGTVRWTLDRPRRVRLARWNGPDGFRIAYLDGNGLRVVDGDGTGDRPLAGGVAAVAPAWRPGPAHDLAYARRDGAVLALAADSGSRLFGTPAGPRPISLQWTGGDLLVVRPKALGLYDSGGRLRWRWASPPGASIRSAAASPDSAAASRRGSAAAAGARAAAAAGTRGAAAAGAGGAAAAAADSGSAPTAGAGGAAAAGVDSGSAAAVPGARRIAVVLRDGHASRLLVLGPGKPRVLFSGPGRFGPAQWSPAGDRLLLPWPSADHWLFLDPSGAAAKLDAVGNVAAQFAPGASAAAGFPSVAGWCCSR